MLHPPKPSQLFGLLDSSTIFGNMRRLLTTARASVGTGSTDFRLLLLRRLSILCSIFGRRRPTWLVGLRGERPEAAGRGVRASGLELGFAERVFERFKDLVAEERLI